MNMLYTERKSSGEGDKQVEGRDKRVGERETNVLDTEVNRGDEYIPVHVTWLHVDRNITG